MNLALFDFDGTITQKDSLIKFIRHVVGDVKLILGFFVLSPILIAFKLKLIPNQKAKERLLSYFFKGMKEVNFKKIASDYSLNFIDNIARPKALEKIAWHKNQGHQVVVVSASIESWLQPWCDQHGLELIATQMEFSRGVVTGKIKGSNCYGKEKAIRIKQRFNLEEFDHIYAYGDSRGDKEMLALAHTKGFRVF